MHELLNRAVVAEQAAATTDAERRRWQVIVVLADGLSLNEIASVTGYRLRTIRQLSQHYREAGAAGLVDRRAQRRGAPPILSVSLQQELQQILQDAPSRGEIWTGLEVADWIATKTGRHVHRQRGWEYLRGFSLRIDSRRKPKVKTQTIAHRCHSKCAILHIQMRSRAQDNRQAIRYSCSIKHRPHSRNECHSMSA